MEAPENHPALVTRAEAGRLLGLSRRTVSKLIERGTLRTFQIDAHSQPRLRREGVLALGQRHDERGGE